MRSSGSRVTVPFVGVLLCAPSFAQVTQRVNVTSAGTQVHGFTGYPWLSADGRYVVFESFASDLVPGDTNGHQDVFVRDRLLGLTERISVGPGGVQANANCGGGGISADGRYVAFYSRASNLVTGDTNMTDDAFVRDRLLGITERVSVDSSGAQGNGSSGYFGTAISADGRYVAFGSAATNLVPGDTNVRLDVFVRDRLLGHTDRVSVDSTEAQANQDSYLPSISADGRYVAFESAATNLASGDTNGRYDVFVRDRQLGTTERVSIGSAGEQGNSDSLNASISADGRFVAFSSYADNLVPGDTNGASDVFVHDRQTAQTERVSVGSGGAEGNGNTGSYSDYWHGSSISADGRYVAFESEASNLVPGDTNASADVFVRDRQSGTTERVSISSAGGQGNYASGDFGVSISADGRYVAFESIATNLVPQDTNVSPDIFVRDRLGNPNFISLCDPGASGVISCPCSNPPSGSGRGCDNSSSTGGATLTAAGGTYLSSDSLVFETSGEKPNALSILMQGNGAVPGGVVYGQGVRCLGGTIIRRLFITHAISGAITAPDFGAGDPTVSARSAAKGDVIQAGQSRWYLVYYRDPIVLGGCPAGSTFNATQTGQITWSP